MAIYRKIHVSFWSDSFVSELSQDKKLFYIYLLTNERTKQCGVYEITKRQMSFDTGFTVDKINKLLKHFIKENKVRYNEQTNEIGLANWMKYNNSTSPKVQSCINKEFKEVKDTVLIEYVKGMHTETQEEEEQEQKEEQTKEEIVDVYPFEDFWNDYDKKKNREKCEAFWITISDTDKLKIKEHIPKYKESQPDKQFRKDPLTFLRNKSWNDEIIERHNKANEGTGVGTHRIGTDFSESL